MSLLLLNGNKHYLAVSAFYGSATAKRSQVPLLAHIDEGLRILQALGSPLNAMEAFCIHPLLQGDAALIDAMAPGSVFNEWSLDMIPVVLAMEYRSVANAYLPHHCLSADDVIRLSPLQAVNDMLIADKVQNRKDFEIHHLHSHENRDRLALYFNNWLRRLGVSEHQYQHLVAMVNAGQGRQPG